MGTIGLVGYLIYFRIYWRGLMVYTTFIVTLVFLPSFGDEGRRLLLFYSAWIPFSLLAVNNMFFYLRTNFKYIYDKKYKNITE